MGGWGLKNPILFAKALATKAGWRLISSNNLWTKVISHKYIASIPLEDWIRNSVFTAPQNGRLFGRLSITFFLLSIVASLGKLEIEQKSK